MADTIEFSKRSYVTLFMSVMQQATPTSPFVPYNLSATTGTFTFSSSLGGASLLKKASTDPTQMLYTNSASGELEVYILDTDTASLDPGTYYFTLYILNASGQTYAAVTDRFKLKDTVQE